MRRFEAHLIGPSFERAAKSNEMHPLSRTAVLIRQAGDSTELAEVSLPYVAAGKAAGQCLDGFPAEDYARGRSERERPGFFETEDVRTKHIGLPYLLRETCRRPLVRTSRHVAGIWKFANSAAINRPLLGPAHRPDG